MAKKKKKTGILAKGKKKAAVARVSIKKGKGRVRINSVPLELYQPELMRQLISEPLILSGDLSKEVDVSVNVNGGGVSGQAQAARTALGKALVKYSKDRSLRELFVSYDRSLVVDDTRRVESKKPLRKGARARTQKSYR